MLFNVELELFKCLWCSGVCSVCELYNGVFVILVWFYLFMCKMLECMVDKGLVVEVVEYGLNVYWVRVSKVVMLVVFSVDFV